MAIMIASCGEWRIINNGSLRLVYHIFNCHFDFIYFGTGYPCRNDTQSDILKLLSVLRFTFVPEWKSLDCLKPKDSIGGVALAVCCIRTCSQQHWWAVTVCLNCISYAAHFSKVGEFLISGGGRWNEDREGGTRKILWSQCVILQPYQKIGRPLLNSCPVDWDDRQSADFCRHWVALGEPLKALEHTTYPTSEGRTYETFSAPSTTQHSADPCIWDTEVSKSWL
jgi:hypothetical protein